ncbi:MAG: hypothetical protein ACOC4K_05585 [Verrucomicrobiota bacterium]
MKPTPSLRQSALLVLAAIAAPLLSAQDGWFDFDPPKDAFTDQALLDLRFLNEREAGENGRIIVRGEHFAHEATGEPVRFWGVNRGGWDRMSQKEWQEAARMLAKRGVNLVRFHSGIFHGKNNEGEPKWDVDENKLDALFYAIAALKEEGIYSHLSLYFPLWLKGPDPERFPGIGDDDPPFMQHVINEDFESIYRSWWKKALTGRNPYTGMTLGQDPAVMGLELINEDSFFFWTFPGKVPERYLATLRKEFGDWAADEYGSLDKAMRAWDGAKVDGDDPAKGELGFPHWSQVPERKSARDQDTVRFLALKQRGWADETIDWMKGDLGFGGLVTVGNWTTADSQTLEPLERWTYLDGDFFDKHAYFTNQTKGEQSSWSIRTGHVIGDRALTKFMPRDPTEAEVDFDVPWLRPTWNGMPKMMSETSWLRTNRFRAEAPLFYAAYGALNGTDAYTHFSFDTAKWEVKPNFFVQPWTLMSPTQIGQFPAAALIFRRNYVQEGPASIVLNITEDEMFGLKGLPLPVDGGVDDMRAQEIEGGAIDAETGFDPRLKLTGPVLVNFGAEGGNKVNPDAPGKIDRTKKVVESLTGQLKLNWGEGLMMIDTPMAQGGVGFLGENEPVELGDVMFDSPMEFGSIVAVSLDGEPLAQSRKILVQAMAEERPTGWQTRPAQNGLREVTNLGENPWQARELSGKVFLRGDVRKVTALDPNGYAREVVATENQFDLLPDAIYYIVER